jgi:5'(3')-deoxyribonucleotidase
MTASRIATNGKATPRSAPSPTSSEDDASDFVLGVDLDGVCADFMAGLRPIAAEWRNVPLNELTDEPDYDAPEWKLDDAGGFMALYKYAVTRRDLLRNLPPMHDAPTALRRLWTAKRPRIRIITHRLFFVGYHRQAINQTIEWLDRWDIPYWDICFMKRKDAVDANLYVEDSVTNVAHLRKANKEAIEFINSTNRAHPMDEPTADGWDEVERLVLDRIDQWERSRS